MSNFKLKYLDSLLESGYIRVPRKVLNDLYGSTLCTCCSSACPSFWWKPNKYVGQAGLLQDYRFIVGSHGHATGGRLDKF